MRFNLPGRDICADKPREEPGRLRHLVLSDRLGYQQGRTAGIWGRIWDRRGTLRVSRPHFADQRSILPSESLLRHLRYSLSQHRLHRPTSLPSDLALCARFMIQ